MPADPVPDRRDDAPGRDSLEEIADDTGVPRASLPDEDDTAPPSGPFAGIGPDAVPENRGGGPGMHPL